jgi:hypothetical protein
MTAGRSPSDRVSRSQLEVVDSDEQLLCAHSRGDPEAFGQLARTQAAVRAIAATLVDGSGFDGSRRHRGVVRSYGRWLAIAAGLTAVLAAVLLRDPGRPTSGSALSLAPAQSAPLAAIGPVAAEMPGWQAGQVEAACGVSGTEMCRTDALLHEK